MSPDWFERRPLVILLSLTALFYWQLIFSDAFTYLDSPDLVSQVLPWYNAQAIAWNEGTFPTWDPFVYGGQPLLGQMQPGAAFWLNWPIFWAPMVDGHVNVRLVDLHYGLMHLLPALFMFGLARELGCSRYAALLAGVAFACSGFISSVGWPQMLHGAIWLPLTFWMFHRFVRLGATPAGWASAALCGSSIWNVGAERPPSSAVLFVAGVHCVEPVLCGRQQRLGAQARWAWIRGCGGRRGVCRRTAAIARGRIRTRRLPLGRHS